MSTKRSGICTVIVVASLLTQSALIAQPAADKTGTTIASPERDLVSPLVARRLRAVHAIAELAEISEAQWNGLEQALKDKDPRVRHRVLKLYADHPAAAAKAIDELLPLMADAAPGEKSPVWVAAGEAIASVGPSVIPDLIRKLEPAVDEIVYRSACAALAKLGPASEPALQRLIVLLADDEIAVGPVLFVLQEIGPKAAPAVPLLIRRLDDEDFHRQYWTCRVLGAIGKESEPSIPKLLDLMKNGVTSVRRNAAMALGNIGISSDGVLNGLDAALRDPLAPVRQEALIALGKLGPKAARSLDKIKAIANDEGGSSQADAAWAWWRIAGDSKGAANVLLRELKGYGAPWDAARYLAEMAVAAEAIEPIIAILDEPRVETRVFAIKTLELIGPPASSAKAALLEMRKDPDADVREAAEKALVAIMRKDQ
ncbi:MAG: HEAT repeat domain-containing protein [Pirellulaceae bacterium]